MAMILNDEPILRPVHRVYDSIAAMPLPLPAPTPSMVHPRACRPGNRFTYPPFDRYWRPRGTYFVKPPGGPVVRGPGGVAIAPQPTLPTAPVGSPTNGGQVVSDAGWVTDTVTDQRRPQRPWWPWLAALAAAGVAVAR